MWCRCLRHPVPGRVLFIYFLPSHCCRCWSGSLTYTTRGEHCSAHPFPHFTFWVDRSGRRPPRVWTENETCTTLKLNNCFDSHIIDRVDSEEDLYRLWVEGYQGNATDSLGSHNGYAFSTFDRDNDEAPVSTGHAFFIFLHTWFDIFLHILPIISAVLPLRSGLRRRMVVLQVNFSSIRYYQDYPPNQINNTSKSLHQLLWVSSDRRSPLAQLFRGQSQRRYKLILIY